MTKTAEYSILSLWSGNEFNLDRYTVICEWNVSSSQ